MRRVLATILLCFTVFSLYGCSTQESDFFEPVNFYYCNDLDSREDFENIFVAEVREGLGYTDNKPALLSLYLMGPQDNRLVSPFPVGTTIVSVKKNSDSLNIVFSNHLAQLSGFDLTLAATCVSLTAFELYPCSQVLISCDSALLNGKPSLAISAEEIVLKDDTYFMESE